MRIGLLNEFLNDIKRRVSSLSFNTWFKDSRLALLNEEHVIIIVPTIAHKKHLAESYIEIISEIFNEITGTNFNIEFLLENEFIKNNYVLSIYCINNLQSSSIRIHP